MVVITPEYLARSGTEAGEQTALFCWAATCELKEQLRWMHAIPNAGHRGNKVAASQLKAEGVKAGVADIFLPVLKLECPFGPIKYSGLYIEMKRKNGKQSDLTTEQKAFRNHCEQQGYFWTVCFGWEQARDRILWYLKA